MLLRNSGQNSSSLQITILVLIMSFCFSLKAEGTSVARDTKVLIIHSYHHSLVWTTGQDEGIMEMLSTREGIEVFTEFLDTKRITLKKISDPFAKFIAQKYGAINFDVIIVTDNNALTFVSKFHAKLFPESVVVFSGINNYHPKMLKGFEGKATGVVQTLDPRGTFDLIRKLQPNLERLVVISGTTPTAHAIRDEVKTELREFEESQKMEWLDGLDTDDLLERLASLSKNDAVLLCAFNRDGQGSYYSHKESGRIISKESNAPVYALEDHYLGTGVTGGYMNSSRDQGLVAGRICLELLKTEKVPEVVTTSPNAIMFDYEAMVRFGLDVSILPESAIIINRPVSFYEQYKIFVWNAVVVFCLLLFAFLGVSIGLIRERKAERKQKKLIYDLGKRAREQNCIYEISKSIRHRETLEEIFKDVARLIPPGWLYPEITRSKIYFDNKEYVSEPFEKSQWKQSSEIIINDEIRGSVEVYCLEEKPTLDEGLFLKEERNLIDSIARILGEAIESNEAEEALRESEDQFRGLVESSSDLIWKVNAECVYTYVSPQVEWILGYTPEEVIGKTPLDLMPLEERKQAAEILQHYKETGEQIVTIENVNLHKDGRRVILETSGIPVFDKTGKVTAYIGMDRDVTDRKRNEEELQRSEERLRILFEQAADAIYVCRPDGQFVQVNEKACRSTGYTKDELLCRNVTDINAEIRTPQALREFFNRLSEGGAVTIESKRRRKDGSIFPVEITISYLDMPEGPQILDLVRDITERKRIENELRESERRLSTLMGNLPGMAYRCRNDSNWTMEFISEGALGLTGYSVEELIGSKRISYKDLIHPDDQMYVREQVQEAVSQGKPFQMLYRISTESGQEKWVWERGVSVLSDEGKLLKLEGFVADITDRKRAEEERKELVKVLEYKNKELRDIVYTASHDLRSPLVNIEGFCGELNYSCNNLIELLAEQADGVDKRDQIESLIKIDIPESLRFIGGGAKKMASLLDGLLQISRVGTIEIHSESLDMEKAVREILASMAHQIKMNNVAVTVDSLPKCMGDTHMIDHVFTNLISNAIKYRDPEKESKIKISGRVDGGMSIYCVEDNGVGIAPNHQKKVFEIFHRLNPEGSVTGEGLGLTIVTRITARLGGKVWLESEPGTGSKFFIALPAV